MIDTDIKTSIRYFLQFSYAPSLEEIHTFLSKKHKKDETVSGVKNMIKKGILEQLDCGDNTLRYTLGGYSNHQINQQKRIKYSLEKKKLIKRYIDVVSKVRCVSLIGLSGSVAMNNAGAGDDIDLFVITRAHRMFTARFWLVLIAFLYGQKRSKNASKSHAANKICLNMFLDESDLKMPKNKQTHYIAHEVLQMKPLFDRNSTHTRFLTINKWVYSLYPNAVIYDAEGSKASSQLNGSLLGDIFETFLKRVQLWKISKSLTTERITDTQLWFFPHDFESKLRH